MIEGSGSVSLTIDPDPGGTKTYGSYESGTATPVTNVCTATFSHYGDNTNVPIYK
jgi:hypothetical protein